MTETDTAPASRERRSGPGRRIARPLAVATALALGLSALVASPAEAATVAIADVQGTGSATPFAGRVVTVEGVVTADYRGASGYAGIVIQTPGSGGATDQTPGASDGIFVYLASADPAVAIGDLVRVTGTASERQGQTQPRDRDGPRAGRRRRARRHPAARHAPRRRPRVAREHARDAHGRLPRRIRAPARHLRHALAERRRGSARQGHRRRAAGRRGRPDRRRQPRAPAPARRRVQHPAQDRRVPRGRDAALLHGRPRGPQRRRPGLPGHPVRARLRLRRLAPPAHDAAHVARRGRPRADLHERQPASGVLARGGRRRPHRRVQRPQPTSRRAASAAPPPRRSSGSSARRSSRPSPASTRRS